MIATLLSLSLLGHIDPTHFAGALTEEPAPDLSKVPVSELTPDQLRVEQARLAPTRTAFIGPVIMVAIGGVGVIAGAVLTVGGLVAFIGAKSAMASMSASTIALVGGIVAVVGAVFFLAGATVLTLGLFRLFPALNARRDASERREQIDKRLKALEQPAAPDPAPPAAKPGDALWQGPQAGILVTSF